MQILEPLFDRLVVKVKEPDSMSPSGMILPDNAKEKPQQGVVVAVGHGRIGGDGNIYPLKVKRGDLVTFGKHTGTNFEYEGETYMMMKENEVFSIVHTKCNGEHEAFGRGLVDELGMLQDAAAKYRNEGPV